MQWTPGGESSDIEDRRGESGGGGGGGGFGLGPVHLGLGGTLVVGVLSLVFHQNLFNLFSGGPTDAPATQQQQPQSRVTGQAPASQTAGEQREVQFVSFVVDDVQKTWTRILPQQANRQFHHAHLVLYRDETTSGCGEAQSSTGPFYCPEDEKVYLDLGFFNELKTRFGAPGEFAQAYVIAHEYGHHIQKLLGIEPKVRQLQESNPRAANPLSVKLELQADCYAGVWAKNSQQPNMIDQSDIAAGLQAAGSVGDDRLQRMSRGTVNPESFTHGSSAQREHWFGEGLQSGLISSCNTFANAQ